MDAAHQNVYVSAVVGYAVMVEPPPVEVEASVLVGYAPMGETPAADLAVLVGYAAMYLSIFVGQTLAYAGDTWTFAPTATAVQWRRDGVPILGATGPSYLLAADDLGALITVALIASNASGSGAVVISADVGPVQA